MKVISPISVVFVSCNRKELLYKALQSAKEQTVPVKIIVMDDASTDGTDAMIRLNFPDITYYRSDQKMGPSYLRNEGAKKAESDIVFFFDDDTIVADRGIIEKTLKDFDHPLIGAIAMPFINILQDEKVQVSVPNKTESYIYHAFVAAAFAIKKDVFLQLGGFRKEYFYMGEEGDLCIRLLNAGYYVKAGTASPAHHYQPPNRVSFYADFYGRRNDILFIYLNVPKLYRPAYLLGSILKGILFGIRVKRLPNMLKGLSAGLKILFSNQFKPLVQPVNKKSFQAYRYLKQHEPLGINKISSII